MKLDLDGARALVLGSTSGLGHAVATSLSPQGAEVVIAGGPVPHPGRGHGRGARAALGIDLTRDRAGHELVAGAVAALGGLDICIVNTGGGTPGGIMTTGGRERAAYDAMLRPALEVARSAAPHLAVGGRGRLIFLTARSMLETTPELALSSVMRSGVAAAARSLAVELAPQTLVNVVATGQFDTPALHRFEQARSASEDRSLDEVRADHLEAFPLAAWARRPSSPML